MHKNKYMHTFTDMYALLVNDGVKIHIQLPPCWSLGLDLSPSVTLGQPQGHLMDSTDWLWGLTGSLVSHTGVFMTLKHRSPLSASPFEW